MEIQEALKEMEVEAATSRKFLTRVPTDKFDWQPHPKSMTLKQLAVHVAEIPGWVSLILDTSELDFAAMDYKPAVVENNIDLLACFEANFKSGHDRLAAAKVSEFDETWTMRSGDTIHGSSSKADNIRHAFSQIVHHRAQLGVYLRLLDVPIPGSYGPSADEPSF